MASRLPRFASACLQSKRNPSSEFRALAAGTAVATVVASRSFPSNDCSCSVWHPAGNRVHAVYAQSVGQPGVSEVLSKVMLTKDDESRILAALEENITEAITWVHKPSNWWRDSKTIQVSGVGEITVRSTKLPSYDSHLFLGQTVLSSTTWQELNVVVEFSEGCAKIQKDPVLRDVAILARFNGGPTHLQGEVLRHPTLGRIHSNPNLFGLISPREIDEWTVQWRLKDGLIAESACGLHSRTMLKHAQGSSALEALTEAPASEGYVRTNDHNSGLLIEPLDDDARAGRRGAWRLSYYALTDVNGKIPGWAAREGSKKTVIDYLSFVHKELSTIRSSK